MSLSTSHVHTISTTCFRNNPSRTTMEDTLSIMPGESISDDFSTLNGDASTVSKAGSHRRLVSSRRSSSIYTANSTSSVRTMSIRLVSAKDIVLGSLMLLPIIPRISAARKEFIAIRRSTLPAPLLKHRKLLQDLLKLTRLDNSSDSLGITMRCSFVPRRFTCSLEMRCRHTFERLLSSSFHTPSSTSSSRSSPAVLV